MRIRGRIPSNVVGQRRTIYASGIAGAVYADGTFEIDGLAPGLHTVISLDEPEMFGAVVAIGDQDVENIALAPLSLLPAAVRTPRPPEPAGNIPSGTIVKLATIRGQVVDATARDSSVGGSVRLYGAGQYRDYAIGADGRFETTGMFPGSYTLEVLIAGKVVLSETLNVNRDDISRTLEVGR